jgi:hypothetical protein
MRIVCWESIGNGIVSDGDRRLDGRLPLWRGYRARERLIHFRYLDQETSFPRGLNVKH